MKDTSLHSQQRIILIDALRGFALLGIMLLHSVEHFDFLRKPDQNLWFSAETDKAIMDSLMFLFSGKAYSIFALMFGLSFFIQMDRQKQKGVNFRGRFLWRLIILFVLGFIHSLLYKGDILHMYAMLGVILLFADKISSKVLLAIAVLLLLQIPLLYQLASSFMNPEYEFVKSFGAGLSKQSKEIYAFGSLSDVVAFNVWKGRADVWAWTYYNGRYLQLIALFILGLILGRIRFFEKVGEYKRLTTIVLMVSLILSVAISLIGMHFNNPELTKAQGKLLKTVVKSYSDFTMMAVYLSAFIILYQRGILEKLVRALSYVGKLSLSNYILQAIPGVLIFYGFGLGMYRYLGASWSIMYGILFFVLQVFFSRYWMRHYHYGPFEWFWRALTFGDFRIKFRK